MTMIQTNITFESISVHPLGFLPNDKTLFYSLRIKDKSIILTSYCEF